MGTIADKLQAISNSKTAIKAALEAKGLAPTDVFSSYPALVNGLGGSAEFFDGEGLTEVLDIDLNDYASSFTLDSSGNMYVCFSDSSGSVKKLNPSGAVLWSASMAYPYEVVLSSDEQFAYVRTSSNIKKVSTSTGKVSWTSNVHTKTTRCIAVSTDGYVYSADTGGNIKKINPSSGAQLWNLQYSDPEQGAMSIDMLTAGNDAHVYAYANGSILKVTPSGSFAIKISSALSYESALIVTPNKHVCVLGYSFINDCCAIAVFSEDEMTYIKEIEVPVNTDYEFMSYACADSDGYIYISSSIDGTICKISIDGKLLWSKPLDSIPFSIRTDESGYVYVYYQAGGGYIKKLKQSFGTFYLAGYTDTPYNVLGVAEETITIDGVTYKKCIAQCIEVKV